MALGIDDWINKTPAAKPERLKKDNNNSESSMKLMRKANPLVIPRNHKVEYALNEARTSFEVQPNKDSHDLVQLIEQKLSIRVDS